MILNNVLVAILVVEFLCCTNTQGYRLFRNWRWPSYRQMRKWRGGISAYERFPVYVSSHFTGRYRNLVYGGSGWVDTKEGGNGVGDGKGVIVKRRAIDLPEDRFHLRIEASPCQFLVYDRNADGGITKEEIRDVFPDENLAAKLFRDLDSTTGDDIITQEEFYFMAPKLIYGCDSEAPEPVPREGQQAKDSITTEAADRKTDTTSDDHTEE